jgi:hypothetical protein
MPNYTRKTCRFEKPCEPRSLKQWLACVVHHHATMRAEEIATDALIPYARLKAFANENQDGNIGAEALVRLCRVIDNYTGVEIMLAGHGFHLVADVPVESSPDLVLAEVLDVAAASGHLAEEARAAMANRRIDEPERTRLITFARAAAKQAHEVEVALTPRPRAVGC